MECPAETNRSFCPRTYEPGSRKGICRECLRYHWKMKELLACLFPDDVEKTWDRSLARFIEVCR